MKGIKKYRTLLAIFVFSIYDKCFAICNDEDLALCQGHSYSYDTGREITYILLIGLLILAVIICTTIIILKRIKKKGEQQYY